MPAQKLREQLERLHAELSQTDEIDVSTQEALAAVARDLERLLQRIESSAEDTPPADPADPAAQQAQTNLGMLISELEAKHPRITGVLSQLTDLLAGIGI